jgi:hypothetical protein
MILIRARARRIFDPRATVLVRRFTPRELRNALLDGPMLAEARRR